MFKILRPRVAFERVGLSRSQVYRLVQLGKFPRPVRLGPTSSGFIESEIETWIKARILERDGDEVPDSALTTGH